MARRFEQSYARQEGLDLGLTNKRAWWLFFQERDGVCSPKLSDGHTYKRFEQVRLLAMSARKELAKLRKLLAIDDWNQVREAVELAVALDDPVITEALTSGLSVSETGNISWATSSEGVPPLAQVVCRWINSQASLLLCWRRVSR